MIRTNGYINQQIELCFILMPFKLVIFSFLIYFYPIIKEENYVS